MNKLFNIHSKIKYKNNKDILRMMMMRTLLYLMPFRVVEPRCMCDSGTYTMLVVIILPAGCEGMIMCNVICGHFMNTFWKPGPVPPLDEVV